MPTSAILEVNGLHKEFMLFVQGAKRIRALEDISFTMQEGEVLGLAGKSGAGKSTLMKCIYRTYLPSAGSVRLRLAGGVAIDLAAASAHDILNVRRQEMTYCSQFLHAIPRVPAIEVAAEGLLNRKCPRETALEEVRQAFAKLGLPEELWEAYPSTFSGGEQQRLNICRSILSRPRFLLVDEPTASLDMKTKDAVIDMLLDIRAAGTSILLITHDEHTLRRLADRCLNLPDGRVRETVEV